MPDTTGVGFGGKISNASSSLVLYGAFWVWDKEYLLIRYISRQGEQISALQAACLTISQKEQQALIQVAPFKVFSSQLTWHLLSQLLCFALLDSCLLWTAVLFGCF